MWQNLNTEKDIKKGKIRAFNRQVCRLAAIIVEWPYGECVIPSGAGSGAAGFSLKRSYRPTPVEGSTITQRELHVTRRSRTFASPSHPGLTFS